MRQAPDLRRHLALQRAAHDVVLAGALDVLFAIERIFVVFVDQIDDVEQTRRSCASPQRRRLSPQAQSSIWLRVLLAEQVTAVGQQGFVGVEQAGAGFGGFGQTPHHQARQQGRQDALVVIVDDDGVFGDRAGDDARLRAASRPVRSR